MDLSIETAQFLLLDDTVNAVLPTENANAFVVSVEKPDATSFRQHDYMAVVFVDGEWKVRGRYACPKDAAWRTTLAF